MSAQRQARHGGAFLALALLAAAFALSLGGMSFLRRVSTFEPTGIAVEREAGSWRVTAVTDPLQGLQYDDRILAVAGQTPASTAALQDVLRDAATTEVLVLRDQRLTRVEYRRPPLDPDLPYLVLALTGLAYLGIGIYTVLRDRNRPVRLFFAWTLASGIVYLFTPTPPLDSLGRGLYAIEELARLLLPPLTAHFFLVFPSPLPALRRWRRRLPFLYLPATVLALLQADLMLANGRWLSRGADLTATIARLDRLELIHLIVFAAGAVALLVARIRRPQEPDRRRQLLWLAVGLVGGYLPFAALYLTPLVAGLPTPELLRTLAVLPLALVPLTFAWAILRYRLWDLGAMVRSGTALALTALLGVIAFTLANLAISRTVPPDFTVARQLLAFLTGLGIAVVMLPARRGISGALERLQYGPGFAKRRALRELGRELLHERDLPTLAAHLVAHATEALDLSRADLLLQHGDTLQPLEPIPGLGRGLDGNELAAATWEQGRVRLQVESVLQPASTGLQPLFDAGFRYVFPLTVRERLIGVLLAGERTDGTPLSGADLDLVQSLTQQAALAIENAQLLEEVRARLDQVVQLKENTERVLESSPAGIAVLDGGDRVVSANPAFRALLGRAEADFLGRPFLELVPLDHVPRPGDGLTEARVELGGSERHLQLSAAAMAAAGEAEEQRLVVLQDVSDRVAMEDALRERERLASLGMLAAGVAHEVNTPITGISSYAQMLLSDTRPEDPHYPLLKKVEKQTFRAARIVNSLLELSRDRKLRLGPLDVAAVIDGALDLLADRCDAQGVTVDWQRPGEALQVHGDEGQLDQVLSNLFGNALEAMPEGGRLAVELTATGDELQVVVADTGRGIPPERLHRIFEPFYTTRTGEGGTGLGLAISYNILERMGGSIEVASTPGRGTAFTLRLPRLGAAARPA